MTPNALAHNLAASLANTRWWHRALEACLVRRLPPAKRALAFTLSGACICSHPGQVAPSPALIATSLRHLDIFAELWAWCQKNGVWPASDLQPPQMIPAAPFDRLVLPPLVTTVALADWLDLPHDRLSYFADPTGRHAMHGDFAVNHYITRQIPKHSGGVRIIEAPKSQLKAMQRRILQGILDLVPVHDAAFGFTRGRDCREAAQLHAGESVVMRFDLEDFFTSVTSHRVFGLFRHLGFPHAVAQMLAGLCTTRTPAQYRAGLDTDQAMRLAAPHLPQGAPSSPALANLTAFSLDRRIAGLARRLGANYTRYADDLVLSGDSAITAAALATLPKIVVSEGFTLNLKKTRNMPRTRRQVVTGLVVNSHINTPRATYDVLRATLHHCSREGDSRLADTGFRNQLGGQIAWVASVNPTRGAKLYAALDYALQLKGQPNV